ncbi:uncharacterized protein [Antedon mediterranea]|uniref:uncharacterized protein n=1 Tax=Antedon mediterranea TaxID=105859 RepID=UPI003AF59C3B
MGRTSTATTPEGHMIRFQCHHCPYSSPNKHNLMLHINSHRGHRPYQCHYCPYAASQPSTVRTHTRVRHRDRCKYKCIHCEFYCQKERAISLHLERYHSITTYSIAMYLNSSFVDDQFAAPSDGISVLKGRPSIYDRQARMSTLMNSNTSMKPEYLKSLNMENMLALHQNLANATTPPAQMQLMNSEYNAIMDYTVQQQKEKAKVINDNGVKHNVQAQPMDTSAPLDCSVKSSQSPTHGSEPDTTDVSDAMSNDMESHYECDQCDYACAHESQFIKHLMTMHKDSGIVVVDPSQEGSVEYSSTNAEAAHATTNDQPENGVTSNHKTVNGTEDNSSDTMTDSNSKMTALKSESHSEFSKQPFTRDNGRPLVYASANNIYVNTSNAISHANTNTVVSYMYDAALPNKAAFIKTEAGILPEHINGTHNRQVDLGSGSNRIPSKRKMLNPVQRLDRNRASPTVYPIDNRSPPPVPTSPTSIPHDQSTQTNNHIAEDLRQKQEQLQFLCPHCKIIFPDNLLFVIHRGSHGFNDPFQCNMCGYKAIDKYEFTTHIHGCPLSKQSRD